MIRTYSAARRSYEIVPSAYGAFPGANTFTVIVGKNGTGKSRLLQGVVAEVLKDRVDASLFDREERGTRLYVDRGRRVVAAVPPRKVICVSTSPFDKFPLLRKGARSDAYAYLGLRGLPSQSLSTAYLSRIIASLIRAVARAPDRARSVADVLRYLGYDGAIYCTFSVGVPSRLAAELESSDDLAEALRRLPVSPGFDLTLRQLRESDPAAVFEALRIAHDFKSASRKPRVDLLIDAQGVQNNEVDVDQMLLLLSTGVARLRDVALRKMDASPGKDIFRISEASSGEQSVIMGLLGIASEIEDGSLVCIDEPEVCLHPEWQERYVHLLLETFSVRRDCQFLIATHSPQVVAELPQANCFVMNMTDGQALSTQSLSRRSIDFQLASVFHAPGHNNEYLNRTAMNLFARVASNKNFEPSDVDDLALLDGLVGSLRADDPLKDLIAAISEMRRAYGSRDR